MSQFATLSPIPGFKSWLDAQLENPAPGLLRDDEKKALAKIATRLSLKGNLHALLRSAQWHKNEELCAAIEPVMTRLCAVYLTSKHSGGTRLLDSVAHFHTSNGAIIKQLNWLGNTSSAGMSRSYGMMVNYLYELNSIDHNSEHYSITHEATLSRDLKKVLGKVSAVN